MFIPVSLFVVVNNQDTYACMYLHTYSFFAKRTFVHVLIFMVHVNAQSHNQFYICQYFHIVYSIVYIYSGYTKPDGNPIIEKVPNYHKASAPL